MELRSVYMTASSMDEAQTIARALVERRLAACVNLFPGIISVYEWEGQIHADPEVVMIAKTRAEHLPALRDTVVELHSYALPCVVALPVVDGLQGYLDWVGEQTG